MIESIIRSAVRSASDTLVFFLETNSADYSDADALVIREAGVSVLDNLENLRAVALKTIKVASPTMAEVYTDLIEGERGIEHYLYGIDRAISDWWGDRDW